MRERPGWFGWPRRPVRRLRPRWSRDFGREVFCLLRCLHRGWKRTKPWIFHGRRRSFLPSSRGPCRSCPRAGSQTFSCLRSVTSVNHLVTLLSMTSATWPRADPSWRWRLLLRREPSGREVGRLSELGQARDGLVRDRASSAWWISSAAWRSGPAETFLRHDERALIAAIRIPRFSTKALISVVGFARGGSTGRAPRASPPTWTQRADDVAADRLEGVPSAHDDVLAAGYDRRPRRRTSSDAV